MSLVRYDAYKDSGIEWLGEVPRHWTVKMIKNIFQCFGSGSTPDSSNTNYYDNGAINWLNTTDLKNDFVYETKRKITALALAEKSLKIYPINTLAIAMYGQGETRGNVGLLSIETTTNQAACMMYRSFNSIPKFMLWWFISKKEDIRKINVGATQPNMNQDFVRNLFISLPLLAEQSAIAAHLDIKTAQIDRKIELLGQKAAEYGKLKQSLINETVTCGLDKAATMKDSGVEWIGEVPAHWDVQRIGTAFEERSEKVNDTDFPPLSVSMGGIVPQMESVAKTDNNENRKRVAVGDYVINSRSDRRGASGISIYNGSVSVISIVLAPKRSFFGKYLHHLFRSYSFIEEFYRVGRGIVDDLWTTRYSVMKGIEFAYPSYDEQKVIADFLDEKTSQIDSIVATITSQIDKLKELRKTLINDVVTGKIKVIG